MVKLNGKLDSIRKALAFSDAKVAPLLLAHRKMDASLARRATAPRDAACAAGRAAIPGDIATGVINPDSKNAWTHIFSDREG